MKCNRCGGENNNGEKYCKYCRNQLISSNDGFVYNKPAPEDNSGLDRIMNPKFPIKKFISLVVVIVVVLIAYVALKDNVNKKKIDSPVVGTWYCNNDRFSNDESKSNTTVILKDDGTFLLGKYNDVDNNHYKGTYTVEKLDKTNGSGTAAYYRIKTKVEEFKIDGTNNDDFAKEVSYEIGISDLKDDKGYTSGAIINEVNSSLMFCFKK